MIRTINKTGPDIETLDSLSYKSLSTPICYGGGISTLRDAVSVINNGVERLLLDSIIEKNSIDEIFKISEKLGSQSLIASLPTKLNSGKIDWQYINKHKNSGVPRYMSWSRRISNKNFSNIFEKCK